MPCSFRPSSADMWSIGIAGSIAKECRKATAEETSTIRLPKERSNVAPVIRPGRVVVDKSDLRRALVWWSRDRASTFLLRPSAAPGMSR
ncbi:hypothetical protein GCM10010519_50210 [Streptomyces lactacystinicus]